MKKFGIFLVTLVVLYFAAYFLLATSDPLNMKKAQYGQMIIIFDEFDPKLRSFHRSSKEYDFEEKDAKLFEALKGIKVYPDLKRLFKSESQGIPPWTILAFSHAPLTEREPMDESEIESRSICIAADGTVFYQSLFGKSIRGHLGLNKKEKAKELMQKITEALKDKKPRRESYTP